jgi:hypothetical protein
MAMNRLSNLAHALATGANEVHVDPEVARFAYRSIDRMLAFAAAKDARIPRFGAISSGTARYSGALPRPERDPYRIRRPVLWNPPVLPPRTAIGRW